jgi:hypothetical protein
VPPVISPEQVAEGIEACAEAPKREVNYGRLGRLLELSYAVSPGLFRRFAHAAFVRGTFSPVLVSSGPGNVLSPAAPHAVDGRWRGEHGKTLWRAFIDALAGALRSLLRFR